MYNCFRPQFCCSVLLFIIGMTISARADEGMWLFNAPPLKQLREKYQFEPTPQWLEHLQKASVRFNSGGSDSFVSANGLAITNHHGGPTHCRRAATRSTTICGTASMRKRKPMKLNRPISSSTF